METTLVISADRYEFTDEKTSEIRKGVTLHYINNYRENSAGAVGFKPIRVPATPEVFEAVKKGNAPALYKLDFTTGPGPLGKPTLTVVKAELVRPVKIFEGA
jgi:hypothetical protein